MTFKMTKSDILNKMSKEETLHYLLREITYIRANSDLFRLAYAEPVIGSTNKPVYILEAKLSDWIEIAEIPKAIFDELSQQYSFGNSKNHNSYHLYLGDTMNGSEVYNLVYSKTRKGIIDVVLEQLE